MSDPRTPAREIWLKLFPVSMPDEDQISVIAEGLAAERRRLRQQIEKLPTHRADIDPGYPKDGEYLKIADILALLGPEA